MTHPMQKEMVLHDLNIDGENLDILILSDFRKHRDLIREAIFKKLIGKTFNLKFDLPKKKIYGNFSYTNFCIPLTFK